MKRRRLNKFKTGQNISSRYQTGQLGRRQEAEGCLFCSWDVTDGQNVCFPPHCSLFKPLSLFTEFGMKDDLRKIEVGGVSSHDLYVRREYGHHAEAHCVLGQTPFISSSVEIGPAKWRQLSPTWGMFVLARSGAHPRVTSGRYVKVLPDRKQKDSRNVYTQCMHK